MDGGHDVFDGIVGGLVDVDPLLDLVLIVLVLVTGLAGLQTEDEAEGAGLGSSEKADRAEELGVALDALDVDAVLVRPDRYVAGTAKGERQVVELASVKMPSPL